MPTIGRAPDQIPRRYLSILLSLPFPPPSRSRGIARGVPRSAIPFGSIVGTASRHERGRASTRSRGPGPAGGARKHSRASERKRHRALTLRVGGKRGYGDSPESREGRARARRGGKIRGARGEPGPLGDGSSSLSFREEPSYIIAPSPPRADTFYNTPIVISDLT